MISYISWLIHMYKVTNGALIVLPSIIAIF